jgi:diacylglycerol kinase (ATP)
MRLIKIIANPLARRGITRDILDHRLSPGSYSLSVTRGPGDARRLAEQAVTQGVQKIIIVGGDGTINEVLTPLSGTSIPLGILPAGGANDLAHQLGLPKNLEAALEVALHGREKRIDLVKAQEHYFATVGGLGFGSRVVARVTDVRMGNKWGRALFWLTGGNIYGLIALLEILFRPESFATCRLQEEDREIRANLWCLFIGNQPRLGKRFLLHPAAANDDGALDLCVIRRIGSKLGQLMTAFYALTGRHVKLPYVEMRRAKNLRVDAEAPLDFFGDGELFKLTPPVFIEVMPQALTVMVPA